MQLKTHHVLFQPCLACVILSSLRNVFCQFGDLAKYWRISKTDFFVWIATYTVSVVFDIDYGLFVGIGLSILSIFLATFVPRVAVLGSLSGTEMYLEKRRYAVRKFRNHVTSFTFLLLQVEDVARCRIVGFAGELSFATKRGFTRQLASLLRFDVREHLVRLSYGKGDDAKLQIEHDSFDFLILDLSGVAHLDPAGAECLTELCKDFRQIRCEVLISGLTGNRNEIEITEIRQFVTEISRLETVV